MGMFDYIICEMPLPKTPEPPVGTFQTKDTPDQYMTTYTITEDGRLSWRPYTIENVPREERPYPDAPEGSLKAICGMIRRVESDPEVLEDFHGDVHFYTGGPRGWWEYRARFTDGVCKEITLVERD